MKRIFPFRINFSYKRQLWYNVRAYIVKKVRMLASRYLESRSWISVGRKSSQRDDASRMVDSLCRSNTRFSKFFKTSRGKKQFFNKTII